MNIETVGAGTERQASRAVDIARLLSGSHLALSIHDADCNVLYASRALRELYAEWVGHDLPTGKCFAIFHGRQERCEGCPILDRNVAGEPAGTTRKKPFCWDLLEHHAPHSVERHPIDVDGERIGVVELVRNESVGELGRLYDLATEIGRITDPERLYDLAVAQFCSLGFSAARLYLAKRPGTLAGACSCTAGGTPEPLDLALDRGWQTSFACFDDPAMPTYVVIDASRSGKPGHDRDVKEVGLRIRYVAEDPLRDVFGGRFGWLDIPLLDGSYRVGKITCDVRKGDFFYGEDCHTLSVFSKLLAQAMRRVERMRRIGDEAVLVTAHEVTTPLQMIGDNLSYVRSVLRKHRLLDDDLELVFRDTRSEINHIAFMNEAASTTAEGAEWRVEPVDLYEDICLPIVKMLRRQARDQNKAIEYSESFKDVPTLHLDRIRFQEVIHNLLKNAIKYADPATTIHFLVDAQSDGWIVYVMSEGMTIPEDEKEAIFEEGHRTDEAKKHNVAGTGRGLYLCRKILRQMGTWIRVEKCSDPVTFAFRVPRYITNAKWYEEKPWRNK